MSTTGPYVRSFNPVWFFVDLTGQPCDDTYYLWVLENDLPYLPAPVYHSPNGTPWTDPIQLLANGTLPLDVYFDPNITYRFELRHNLGLAPPSQSDPLIYLVENYHPATGGSSPITVGGVFTDNQISNPQFADINFSSPFTLSGVLNPPPIEIAPGWVLDLTGNGTVELQQVALNDTVPTPTNAPYALRITLSGGWTGTPKLKQRFQQNGVLWANKYVALSFTARIQGASQQVTSRLIASDGNPLAVLANDTLTGSFAEFTSYTLLPASTNADTPPDAWIEYQLLMPTACDIYVTSFQLVASDAATNVSYEQDTIDRQLDYLFHYYNPLLQFKPIKSYLVGWDFPLNPAQILTSSVAAQPTGANSSYYAWDQTIIFQSADSGVTTTRGTTGGINLQATKDVQFAVVQYLDSITARKILQNPMSVNVLGLCSVAAGSVIGSVSLWYTKDAQLPDVSPGTNKTFIATLDASTGAPATFTAATNFIEITRDIQQDAAFTIDSGVGLQNFAFSGWDINNGTASDANLATYFAIVIGFTALANNDYIELNSVSLVPGNIPTIPAPQTVDEALNECQRFYEKSYQSSQLPATITDINALMIPQQARQPVGGNTAYIGNSFYVECNIAKRVNNPDVKIYASNSGTADSVSVYMNAAATSYTDVGIARWTLTTGNKYQNFLLNNVALTPSVLAVDANTAASASINFHYVVDARLGIVL